MDLLSPDGFTVAFLATKISETLASKRTIIAQRASRCLIYEFLLLRVAVATARRIPGEEGDGRYEPDGAPGPAERRGAGFYQ